jgi:hypothetical protein
MLFDIKNALSEFPLHKASTNTRFFEKK